MLWNLHIYNITVKLFINISYLLIPTKNPVLCGCDILLLPQESVQHLLFHQQWLTIVPITSSPPKIKLHAHKKWKKPVGEFGSFGRASVFLQLSNYDGKRDGLFGPTGVGCVWVHPSAWSAASYHGNHWVAVNGDHLVPIHTVGKSRKAHVIIFLEK